MTKGKESTYVLFALTFFFICASYGQEFGTQEAHKAVMRGRNQGGHGSSSYDDTWGNCTKLALSTNDIPKAARMRSSELSDGFKVLDPSEFKEGAVGYLEHLKRTTVVRILNEREMIITFGGKTPEYVCLVDYPTKGRVDGESIRLIGPILVSGTRQYKNSFNRTRTRRAIRFLTADEVQANTELKD